MCELSFLREDKTKDVPPMATMMPDDPAKQYVLIKFPRGRQDKRCSAHGHHDARKSSESSIRLSFLGGRQDKGCTAHGHQDAGRPSKSVICGLSFLGEDKTKGAPPMTTMMPEDPAKAVCVQFSRDGRLVVVVHAARTWLD